MPAISVLKQCEVSAEKTVSIVPHISHSPLVKHDPRGARRKYSIMGNQAQYTCSCVMKDIITYSAAKNECNVVPDCGCGPGMNLVARSVRILSGRIIFVTRWNMEPNPQDPEKIATSHWNITQHAEGF